MVRRYRYIAYKLLLMMFLWSMMNEVWAVKVKYHILTIPFTTQNADGSGNLTNRCVNIRVEALLVVVDETSPKVGLPAHFKSPLAENFKYYAAANAPKVTSATDVPSIVADASYFDSNGRVKIYQYMPTAYDAYKIPDASLTMTENSAIAADCDIFVTYDYNPYNGIAKLDGTQDYNIKLGDRFLCFNKDRANRPAAMAATKVTEENLNSDGFTYIAQPGFNSNKNHWFHFRFWFEGSDPYNITLRTSYEGNETFSESDKALNKKVLKEFKGASLFCQGKDNGGNMLWLSSDDNYQYTDAATINKVAKPGFYRGGNGGTAEMNPIWNSFAMLNADNGDGYVFMGTKINSNGNEWQPKNGNQYFYLTGNIDSGNNPKFQLKTPATAESTPEEPYEVRTYTFNVTSPLSGETISATMQMSEFIGTASLLTHIPDKLKRKYATFTGAYREAGLSNAMTTFADVEAANNGRQIWLKYTSSMPFESLSSGGSYADARWYTIRMNGQAENQYVAFYDTSNSNHFSTGRGSNDNDKLHQGENSAEAQVAFIGDPFELKIISRYASETATPSAANRYIGCASGASVGDELSSMTGSPDISSWEIEYDIIEGTIVLRQFNTYGDDAKYIGWAYGTDKKPLIYSTTASRIKVVELEKKTYYYHIVKNNAGDVAAMASIQQDVGIPLKPANIPEIIRSPFLALPGVASITFFESLENAKSQSSAITNASYLVTESTNKDIYVRYDMGVALDGRNLYKLDDTQSFNVRLNGQYIYYDAGVIKSKTEITPSEASSGAYQWRLEGGDPYAMIIYNHGANAYVKTTLADGADLTFDAVGNATPFIAKSSPVSGVYEVMASTGDDVDAGGATPTYYNIGRNTDNIIKLYSNATYPHGYTQLRFLLTATTASEITYHLVDNAGTDLLQVKSRRSDLFFPADYRSPLVDTYHYYTSLENARNKASEIFELSTHTTIYVRYDTSDRIDLQKGTLYLLKYEQGETCALEDGSDGLSDPVKAIYPYCNGDCNFFVYGQDQYDLQQEGAASTRTRWAWYLESTNNDPYHVKICSRQQESFNNTQNRGYFCTYVENFKYPDDLAASNHVITSLVWPGITGDQGTEYMILGTTGQYQLVTSLAINDGSSNERRIVKSFEQYWKTFDTIRKKVFGESSAKANLNDPSTVPATPLYSVTTVAGRESNRDYLEQDMKFHHYTQWAYAKRWNGYNISGKTSKGWEDIEHWYQTVDMGEGYFDFVETTIEPALILLDQHGWEIMRKPLPTSPDDPTKAAKYAAIRPYDSPMVKEYIFWSSAKKRSGMHQYYLMDKRIGGDYTSTSLADLPPYGSENVLDSKGNLNDQYVTYIVKDEYAQSYAPNSTYGEPGSPSSFLIQQGNKYGYNNGTANIQAETVPTGGMPQYIIDNISTIYLANPTEPALGNKALWFIKPNARIDYEMGYTDSNHNWGSSNPNAYEDPLYNTNRVAGFITGTSDEAKALIKKYGAFTFSNGFDPYNIQISSVAETEKYFVTNASGAILDNGDLEGTYSATPAVTLGTAATGVTPTWYDGLRLNVTNATFMVVQDADGNMQLMPRFDHDRRVRDFSKIEVPVAQDNDPNKLTEMETRLFRPMVYNYHIIDNTGKESLRYRTAGELLPRIPDHFKSPLAMNFSFYKELTLTDGIYTEVATDVDITSKEITASLAGAGLTATNTDGNEVYVRYDYDEEADATHILSGKWFTIQLNDKDVLYNSGIKQSDTKPDPVDGTTAANKSWQWKFLETPQSEPDPYAISLFNRNVKDVKQPSDIAADLRFALLKHGEHYALARAGTENYTNTFLNGSSMNATTAATITTEAGFTGTAGIFSGTGSQVKLIDDVVHTYRYRVFTNGTNGTNAVTYGVEAIDANQSQAEASQNGFVPTIPDAARTPLLEQDMFLYYEAEADMGNSAKELKDLYGLYDDDVFVRYKPYSEQTTTFKVPNDKTTEGGHVARGSGSNDTPLGLGGNLLYNIVWYNDKMMKSNGTTIEDGGSKTLQSDAVYEWQFEGGDPYAIKIKSVGSANNYVHDTGSGTCDLNVTPTTFMLLPRDGYDYGVLTKTGTAVDGQTPTMLSGYGNALTTDIPTKYIIFALATHKVFYHLILANINNTVTIPYRATRGDSETTKTIIGTTQRDLTSGTPAGSTYQLGETKHLNGVDVTYSYDAGCISLGDPLSVPDVFYRPNVNYHFFVEGVYTDPDCDRSTHKAALDDTYRGLEVTEMGREEGLLGKTVRINIVYSFNKSLDTNSGEGFVTDVTSNKWYTFETKVGSTPWLAQYTNAWGLEVKSGRGSHYTNDYLWSPLGDPYGFVLYNRYIYKNSGASNSGEQYRVMTSSDFSEERQLSLSNANNYAPDDPLYTSDANSVYELLSASSDGYFRVHPVVNKEGDQYYFKTFNDGADGVHIKLSTSATEFTFGLSKDLIKPYFDRVGYVGGLKQSVYDDPANETYVAAMKNDKATLTASELMTLQSLVYNDANIQGFTSGYYRLHSPDDIEGVMEERYASGYTHKTELTDAIPMHFYEKKGVNTTFENLGGGFTSSNATRGEIPIPAVEYDPASIFYFPGTYDNTTMCTQGLYVKGAVGRTEDDGSNAGTIEASGVRTKAYMTETPGEATPLWIMDIGGAVMLIHDRSIPRYRKYLSYHQNDGANIYDLKLTHNTHTDHAKWCLQPVNNLGLHIATHSGGDEGTYGTSYNYCSFYAPFDILLPADVQKTGEDYQRTYQAFILDDVNSAWNPSTDDLHPKAIGSYNAGTYAGNNKFVPAGTPVLLAMWDQDDFVKVTIPTNTPSAPLTSGITNPFSSGTCNNLLTGSNLEQLLSIANTERIFTFGMQLEASSISLNASTGEVTAVLPTPANAGIGFYLNANPNKELGSSRGSWTRNNRYVYSNKVYYRAAGFPSSAREHTRGVQFVPVVFGFDDNDESDPEQNGVTEQRMGDGCVYDLLGRKVATEQQAKDGTWRQYVAPGIYIVHGKKVKR